LSRALAVASVEFIAFLLILLAVHPSVVAASELSSNGPTAGRLAGSVPAGYPTQYVDPWYYCYQWDYSWCYEYYWWNYPYYSWNYPYYWWYSPYYYETPVTTKTFELKVETNPSGVGSVNGKGTYNDGTIASFSVASLIIPFTPDQRYIFAYWSGDFSGATPSGTVTMNSAKTVVANYQLQNYLKISTDPPGVAAVAGEGWHLASESVTVGPVPVSVSGGAGARYIFQDWMIDDAPVSGNTVQVTMDIAHSVVAQYKTEYLLTVVSEYGTVEGAGWYDAGSSATLSVQTQVDTSYGVKQVFERWTGDLESASATASIRMDSPRTVTAVWRTDSTVLYATIGLGIAGAFTLGIGLAVFAISGRSRADPAAPWGSRPVEMVKRAVDKLKIPQSRRKVKPSPKTE
jgi:hypothetical protein